MPDFKIAQTVKDGEILSLCGLEINVYLTAGHTAGSVCYVCGSYLFSGDTLFKGSIGRTDLPTGNINELFESLKLLKALKGDFTVYCGHGEATSLNTEIKYNPYMRNLDA